MSDDPVKGGAEYPAVTFQDAVEYFTDKVVNRVCELCGNDTWDVLTKKDDQVPGFVIQDTNDFSTNSVLPVVFLQCKNCGNLKTFLERPIYTYLQLKRAKAAQEGPSDV